MTPAQRVGLLRGAGAFGAAVILIATPFVAKWEGEELVAYPDLGGVITICNGHTGPDVALGQRKTREECRVLLQADLEKHADHIRPCVPATVPVESQAAFLSLAINVGSAAVCRSSIAPKLRAGNVAAACATISEFDKIKVAPAKPWPCRTDLRYVAKSGARYCISPGLRNRRKDERALCERGLRP